MSVIVKGMKMPERCEKCFMCQSDCMGCKVTQNFIILKKGQNKPLWCPLVEVSPHGRLIDADSLDNRIYCELPIKEFGNALIMRRMRELVDEAPTIIEAEGEENG